MLNGSGSALSSAARQSRAQAKYAIGLGAFVLVFAAAAFILYLHYSGDISAYESASSCASPGDALQGQACVHKGQARALSTGRHDRLEAVVEFDSLPAHTFGTSFPNNNEPSSTALTAGTTTDGEIWAGKVTRLAGKPTVDNPEAHPANALPRVRGRVLGGRARDSGPVRRTRTGGVAGQVIGSWACG